VSKASQVQSLHRPAQRGVTLIELMVVVAIVGIIGMIGAPSFARMVASNTVTSQVNGFLIDAQFSRSEALKRGTSVTMCRSANPDAATPTCVKPTDAGGWETGWIIFVDSDNDGVRTSDEQLLRVQQTIGDSGGIQPVGGAYDVIRYRATGWATGKAASLRFLPRAESAQSDVKLGRTVCVNTLGRVKSMNTSDAVCAAGS
jgi:type IV fimbrial biogenesis protein FimT